jgi:hypothetical protein
MNRLEKDRGCPVTCYTLRMAERVKKLSKTARSSERAGFFAAEPQAVRSKAVAFEGNLVFGRYELVSGYDIWS